jgi:hypothetical protein
MSIEIVGFRLFRAPNFVQPRLTSYGEDDR